VVSIIAELKVFFKKINSIDALSLNSINSVFNDIELSINYFINKIKEKGFEMPIIELKKVDNIENIIPTINENIKLINSFFVDLNNKISETPLIVNAASDVSNIKYKTDQIEGTISIYRDNITVIPKDKNNIKITSSEINYNDESISL